MRSLGYISEAFDDREYVGCTFCDLSKAFDCVSHKILIKKCGQYGLSANCIQLLNSYLHNRLQCTYYNNLSSTYETVQCGVPQGSVLGPILFIMYVNELPASDTISKFILYADDTTILNRHADLYALLGRMREARSGAERWFAGHGLVLNPAKTEDRIFTLRDMENAPTGAGDPVNFLGVTLDSGLRWEDQVNKLCKKLSSCVFLMRTMRKIVQLNCLKTVYFSLFESVYCYAILSWGHTTHLSRVFSVQRRVLRVILGLPYRENVREHFRQLGLLTVPSMYIFRCLLFLKSNSGLYGTGETIHEYDTRNKNQLSLNYCRVYRSRNAENYYAPKFFNKLPHDVRELPAGRYRNRIKQLLVDGAYYSCQEFLSDNRLR